MTQNKLYHYGKHDGKRGLEARYMLIGTTLSIKIEGSNIWIDYLDCFLFAWPRVRPFKDHPNKALNRCKFHRKWWDETEKFDNFLRIHALGVEINEYQIMGHSAGGPQGNNLTFLLPPRRKVAKSVNAPRTGNRAAMAYMVDNAIIETLYDAGDIVRRWPILYAKNPNGRCYGRTRGLEKAHINMPVEWNEFFN